MLKTRNLEITLEVEDSDGAVSEYHFRDLDDERKLLLMRGVAVEKDGETVCPTRENLSKMLEVSLQMFDEMLIGWEGVTDIDGNPLEYNDENKKLALKYEKDFCIHLCEAAQEKFAEKNKEIKKKCVNGRNGTLSKGEPLAKNVENII